MLKRKSGLWRVRLLLFVSFVLVSMRTNCPSFRDPSSGAVKSYQCEDPSLLLVVLTQSRRGSLLRLLSSLAASEYGCASVDLCVHVDMFEGDVAVVQELVDEIDSVIWPHGRKTIIRKFGQRGLANSWFESVYNVDHTYVSILEDDMEVSHHFYNFLRLLHSNHALTGDRVSGLCLHPDDWAVGIKLACRGEHSRYLYKSPEPCNWGPVWKAEHWRDFITWVFQLKSRAELPFVEDAFSYNFNSYLEVGADVQSSWVWRYNLDHNIVNVRYRFRGCVGAELASYFAINHKEAGLHFQHKLHLNNEPSLLQLDWKRVEQQLQTENYAFIPAPFANEMLDQPPRHVSHKKKKKQRN